MCGLPSEENTQAPPVDGHHVPQSFDSDRYGGAWVGLPTTPEVLWLRDF